MIVVLETGTTEKQIEEIIRVLHDHGFDVHRSTGVQHTVLAPSVFTRSSITGKLNCWMA